MRVDLKRFHRKAKAIFEREQLHGNKQRVVAFVLDAKGHILTEGWNSYTKTHPIQKQAALEHEDEFKCFLHAEVHALSRLSYKQLTKQEAIVVIRMDSKMNLLPAAPCPICDGVIDQYGIDTVIHS